MSQAPVANRLTEFESLSVAKTIGTLFELLRSRVNSGVPGTHLARASSWRATSILQMPPFTIARMCGRYTLRTKLNLLLSQFAAELSEGAEARD